ncbi:MAG: TIM barrel protein [Planctomycetota bacterium]|nr:TIM barrel protein [Planctomycetota bacterium]
MNRRNFLYTGALATAGASSTNLLHLTQQGKQGAVKPFKREWRMRYAPRLDWGPGSLIERVERVASYGFTGVEFNWLARRKMKEITDLRKRMDQLDVKMGIFVANGNGRRLTSPEGRGAFLKDLDHSIEVHKVIGNNFCTTLTGNVLKGVPRAQQKQALIDNLKAAADKLEGSGLTLVVEPLNPLNHRGYFLVTSPESNEVMKAVGSKHVKILFDIYHQQISEGNLIHNIRKYWDEIAYFQVGDVPGRREPLTGEINYRNVFKAIYDKGYRGFLGMEHGLSKKGPAGIHKCFEAYRWCDSW